jgi:hypothetical protein
MPVRNDPAAAVPRLYRDFNLVYKLHIRKISQTFYHIGAQRVWRAGDNKENARLIAN